MADKSPNINSIDSIYPRNEVLGRGGGGIVYKSYDESRKQNVVVKEILGDRIGLDNARREIDLLKNVKSTYLPQVYSFVQIGDQAYTIMEYVEGQSLGKIISEKKGMLQSGFSQDECIRLFKELAEALRILHSADPPICHRDIKPDNVMLTEKRRKSDGSAIKDVCLIDFNVSSVIDGHEETRIGFTPPYASPEQIAEAEFLKEKFRSGNASDFDPGFVPAVDSRSDIYSLGATMYHAISGVAPKGPLEGIQTDINQVCDYKLMEPFARIIMKCMANRPDDRYQDAEELLKALDNVYRDTKEFNSLRRRHTAIRISLIITALIGVGMIFTGFLRMGQEQDMAYLEAVEEASGYRMAGDQTGMEEAVSRAAHIYQSRPEAYVQEAQFFYEKGDYEKALEYLNEIALPYVSEEPGKANLYLLAGKCYRETGELRGALEMVDKALELWGDNPEIIEEKAVICAMQGDGEAAKKLLKEAEDFGIMNDSLAYTKGEIASAGGDTDAAYASFEEAAANTEDMYLKYRAYVQMIKILSAREASSESLDRRVELTDRAMADLSATGYMEQIYQYRFQALIDKAVFTKDKADAQKAVDEMNDYVKAGNGQFDTWQSMIKICNEYELYDKERELLSQMLDRFGDDYRIYADMAYMELSLQIQKDNSQRDYHSFEDAYLKADELYRAEGKMNQVDPEMENLSGLYGDVVSAGWLEGR